MWITTTKMCPKSHLKLFWQPLENLKKFMQKKERLQSKFITNQDPSYVLMYNH